MFANMINVFLFLAFYAFVWYYSYRHVNNVEYFICMQIVTSPKRRSNGWISTSTLESHADEESTQFCSAEYLVNNLTNPVFFHGAMRHVPENALVLEVAPHCLLQAILKRSLTQHQTVLGLVNKRAKNVEDSFLQSLGR